MVVGLSIADIGCRSDYYPVSTVNCTICCQHDWV